MPPPCGGFLSSPQDIFCLAAGESCGISVPHLPAGWSRQIHSNRAGWAVQGAASPQYGAVHAAIHPGLEPSSSTPQQRGSTGYIKRREGEMEINLLAQRGAHISLGSCRNRVRGQIASRGHLPQAMLYWVGRGAQWPVGHGNSSQ